MSNSSLIEINGITKRYGGVAALDDVSLNVSRGEFHAIVGENGAGKSTLMKILAGVIIDYQGDFRLRGEAVRFAGPRDAENAGVSIIHQELNLVEELSAAANIFLGREKRTSFGLLDNRRMQQNAAALFEELDCDIRSEQQVGALRVGDRQLVEIAKALSIEADILIMDEPTSALTETEVERLFGVIERLLNRGVTILYISHKLDEVFRRSDHITVLRDGRLVKTLARTDTNIRAITHLMVGREIEEVDFPDRGSSGDVVLKVDRLRLPSDGHARQWRLEDISFSLRRGEVLGVAGLMGAGRTELLECLFGTGSERPEGRIQIDGEEVTFFHPSDAMRAGVALVTEDRKQLGLFNNLTVRENITVCTLAEWARGGLLRMSREKRSAEESITILDIKTSGAEADINSLSGGNQQKCIIARWLRTRPKVLLLDDPTRGVDVGAKAEIYKVIDRLCRDGLGILITSSELPELITLCDRILVLCEGRLTGEFSRSEFTEQAIMEAATRRAVSA